MEVAGMINDESRRKLREMNLGEIISGLEAQQAAAFLTCSWNTVTVLPS